MKTTVLQFGNFSAILCYFLFQNLVTLRGRLVTFNFWPFIYINEERCIAKVDKYFAKSGHTGHPKKLGASFSDLFFEICHYTMERTLTLFSLFNTFLL